MRADTARRAMDRDRRTQSIVLSTRLFMSRRGKHFAASTVRTVSRDIRHNGKGGVVRGGGESTTPAVEICQTYSNQLCRTVQRRFRSSYDQCCRVEYQEHIHLRAERSARGTRAALCLHLPFIRQ